MARQCNRFAKLVLGYLGETQFTPVEFSEFIRDWRNGGISVNGVLGGPETMAMLLAMIFATRHRLQKDLLDPEFDSMAFFLEYQLNRPLSGDSGLFAGLLQGLPPEVYKELADSSMNMTEMFTPQPSPWTQPGLFGTNKTELSHEPLAKPKPLPKPTHKAPSTLQ